SAAARRLHRTQPAISQAVRRIEDELGERLFDRSSRDGTLTEAGRLLQDYAQRLLGLVSEAETAVRELQQVRRGRVIIGANEAAVHSLLPHIEKFTHEHPNVVIAHNDPSPTRDRVLRAYERRQTSINIQISLPSLDGIKRAVEMGVGVALLPRRCALTEIARGTLVAVRVPDLGAARTVRLVY